MKKVKKFGRGGDIITGLGAVLVGKALYDKYKGGDKDDDYTRRVKEYGTKGKFPEETSEEKATPKREEYVPADKEELDAKKAALSKGMQYKKPEGPAAVEKNIVPPTVIKKKKDEPPSKPYPKVTRNFVPNEERASIPYPEKEAAAKKRQNFLSSKAGLSGKGIPTPGKDKNRQERSKGRSANPIQETIDNADKSMARTPQQKMSEGAREVQRRREEAEKSRYEKGGAVKKYASGGSVGSASTAKGRSEDPIQGTIDNRNKSIVSSDRYKMRERAREVQRQRGEVEKSHYKKGGSVSSASKRADGIAIRGKTRA